MAGKRSGGPPVMAAELPANHVSLQAHEGGVDEILCPGECNAGWLRITRVRRVPVHRLLSGDASRGNCPQSGVEFVRPVDLPAPLTLRLERGSDRWNVRTETGRALGWLTRADGQWFARVSPEAFRGGSADDHGDVLDEVPAHLSKEYGQCRHEPVGRGETRSEATRGLVKWCRDHRSPAFGFGRHPLVERWEDRRRAG